MLYLFYGTDSEKVFEKSSQLVFALKEKKPEAEIFRVEAEKWNDLENYSSGETALDELIGGQGLFNNSYIVELVYLFENPKAKEAFLERLQRISDSTNIFVMREKDIDEKTIKVISEKAKKIQVFKKRENLENKKFNIFSLSDAFGARDKKNLWILLQRAVRGGAKPEEIHGILFWQLKSILLAIHCKTAKESGLKPFVWSKAKSFSINWNKQELLELSEKMVLIYHNAHRGVGDLGIAIERMVLSL